MTIFVSYARADRDAVRTIEQDLDRTRTEVWLDNELEGGQSWWGVILGQIRGCELFVFALSPESLNSKACMAELSYAQQLRRPLLAVMVQPVSPQLAPRAIADSHIVDYTQRTPESAVALVTAVLGRPSPPPLPDPLPALPPTPMSYLNPFREQIQSSELTYQQQAQLVVALKGHLHDDDARDTTAKLLADLRRRPDIAESVGRDIDALLGASAGGESTTGSPAGGAAARGPDRAAGWYDDPAGRFSHRYWDGRDWTEHVSSPAGQTSDLLEPSTSTPEAPRSVGSGPATPSSPTSTSNEGQLRPLTGGGQVATPAGSGTAAFSSGVFILWIVGAFFIPLIGLVVGGINLKHPARKGQSQVLLAVGGIMFVLYLIAIAGGG